jgi:hypothetical protein
MSIATSLRIGLFVFLTLYLCCFYVNAQDSEGGEASLVFVCIDPVNQPTEDPTDAYLVIFRDTSLFGVVVSEASNVMVYSANRLETAMYAITPDMATGGYRRVDRLATSSTTDSVPSRRLCDSQYAEINDNLLATIPLPVTSDHAVLIQAEDIDNRELLDNLPFLGVFSFHIQPTVANLQYNFQILQLVGGGMEVKFPFFPQEGETPYLLVANKDVSVRKSFAGNDEVFSAATPSDDRSLLTQQLSIIGINLFTIIDEANARIYPSDGLYNTYPNGGYLRLEMTQSPSVRIPTFSNGDMIRPLEGANSDYYLVSSLGETAWITTQDQAFGQLSSTSLNNIAQVTGINEQTGQLSITDPGGQGECLIEAWLVEIVPPES